MSKFVALWCAAALLFFGSIACAQSLLRTDSASTTENTKLSAYYHEAIGQSSGLYSGIEYTLHPPNITGIAYYLNNDWNSSTLTYNEVVYHNVLVKYDLVDNQLVALLFNQVIPYVLNQSKVQAFNIGDHHFVYAIADSIQNVQEPSFVTGFYERAYNGPSSVLIRHEKTIETQSNSTNLESYYADRTRLYIRSRGNYYEVSGNGSVISVLKDQKKPVQQYIKSNHLKISKSSPEALVQVAAYYDSLNR